MLKSDGYLSLREVAKLFRVSYTTAQRWLDRGMPPVGEREAGVGKSWRFDIDAVLAWRRAQTKAGKEVGGRPLESIPRRAWERPDLANGCRWLAEQAVVSMLWHWSQCEDGAPLLYAGLLEAHNGDHDKARAALGITLYSLIGAVESWVTTDALTADGLEPDALWRAWTGQQLTTRPPSTPPALVELPPWLVKLVKDACKDL
jgi:hypothetical protein